MADDLLVSLRKYTPRSGKDPIENFFTEAFSWIIENNPSLAKVIIEKMLDEVIEPPSEIRCTTQVNFAGVYPDMLIEFDERVIISEHKVWAELHENQLKNYRDYAKENYSDFSIILITATAAQHTSEYSDRNFCWSEFYEVISSWLKENDDTENKTIISSFLRLLRDEGVGPAAPVSYSSIHYYNVAKNLPDEIDGFLSVLENKYAKRLDSILTEVSWKECKWGRYGFGFLESWNPGLFVGFLLNEKDHNVKPLDGDRSPDFSLIIDFEKHYHNQYPNNDTYKKFKEDLKSIVSKSKKAWDLYDIADNGKNQNRYHPIHIRVPMRKIFIGTEDIDDQAKRFFEYIEDLIPAVLELKSLHKMRDEIFR